MPPINRPVYHLDSVVTESDFEELSIKFKVPMSLVAETVAKLQAGVEVTTDHMRGAVKGRFEELLAALKLRPESEANAPADPTDLDLVTGEAANRLIEALVDPVHNNFIIIDGICSINPDNPPDLPHSYQVVAEVLKLRELGDVIDDKTSWMLGSLVVELEILHGENNFEIGQVCNQTTRAYNTIYQAREVYKAFRDKRYKLPYSTHQEVHFAKIPRDSKHIILKKAETYGIGSKAVRELCSIVRRMDDDTTVNNIHSKEQAEDLIAAYSAVKANYLIRNNNIWTIKKGLATEIPEGEIVIDLKAMTVRTHNGPPELILDPTKKPSKG